VQGDGALVTPNAYLDARNLALAEGRVTVFREAEGGRHVSYEPTTALIRIDDTARHLAVQVYG
jgi:hypothetical protein